MFEFDPATRTVLRTKEIVPFVWQRLWGSGALQFFSDGMLYGQFLGNLVRIDPQSLDVEILATETSEFNRARFAMDSAGRLHFAREADLYRFEFDG